MSGLSFNSAYFIAAFCIAAAGIPIVIRLALWAHCIDHPGGRKTHGRPTPRWGGLIFAVALVPPAIALLAAAPPEGIERKLLSYFAGALLLAVIGGIDDRRHLGWKVKLAGILAAISITVFWGDLVVRDIGTYGTLGKINLGFWGIPFTYLCVIGVTNAINLVDGLNGLAAGISLVAFFFLGLAASFSGQAEAACLGFTLAGAVAGFLIYNFPRARIFMGDSGSLLLGFSYAILAILITQSPPRDVDPMYPILVLVLPIYDTLRVMLIRVLNRKNPFWPDRTHLHHLMVRGGYSDRSAVYWLVGITLVASLAAFLLREKQTSVPFLVIILMMTMILSLLAESLAKRRPRNGGRNRRRDEEG